jgi:hypothetical protein
LSLKNHRKLKKKRIIPLLNFESFIDDELLLHAEKLFDEGKIKDLKDHGSGKWSGIVSDGGQQQVEASIHEGSIHDRHCSCGQSDEEGYCAHLVCLFFGMRHNDALAPPKTSIPKKKKRASNYLSNLLESVDSNDLKTYINSYSSKDKSFKLLLITHFSRQIRDVAGPDLFEKILDECFPVKTQNNQKSLTSESRLLIRVAKEILSNYRDALSLESYKEAFEMIQALNHKISYALFILPKENKSLLELEKQTHAAYKMILNDRMAPALKHEIVRAMILSIGKSFYKYKGQNNLYDLVVSAQPSLEQLDFFRTMLLEKMERSEELAERSFLMAYFIHAAYHSDKTSLSSEKMSPYVNDQVLLVETIRKMLDFGFYREAEFALDFYHEKERLDELTFYRFQLKFQLSKNQKKKTISSAQKLFELSLDSTYLDIIKKQSGDQWEEHYRYNLEKLCSSNSKQHFLFALSLTKREKDYQMLYQLLKEKNDLKLFLEYDNILAESHPSELHLFYRDHVVKYLEEHAGEKSAREVIAILQHLNAIGLSKIRNQLEKEILEQFPERKTMRAFIRSVRI